jgi:hypothetical protein
MTAAVPEAVPMRAGDATSYFDKFGMATPKGGFRDDSL